MWSSSRANGEPLLSLPVHHLNTDWQLNAHCLETQYFPEDHEAEHICEMMENMLLEWKIRKKRVCLE